MFAGIRMFLRSMRGQLPPHRFMFFLLIVLLPTQIGYHWWPDWSIVLGRRVDYLSPTLYATDVALLILVALWIMGSDIISRTAVRVRTSGPLPVVLVFGCILFAGANIWESVRIPETLYAWGKALEFAMLGYYVIAEKPSLRLISLGFAVGVIYSSIVGLLQFFFQHSVGGMVWWLGERTFSVNTPGIARLSACFFTDCPMLLRPYATFPHPNVFGGFLALTLPLLLFCFFSLSRTDTYTLRGYRGLSLFRNSGRMVFAAALALGIPMLVLTFSRSAWLVALLGFAAVGWKTYGRMRKIVFTVSVVFVALVAVGFSHIQMTDESVVVREQLAVSAWDMFRTANPFGVGLGNFLIRLPEFLSIKSVYFLQPVHSIYLLVLSETGVLGCMVFLTGLAAVFFLRLPQITRDVRHTGYSPAYFLAGILLLGLVDHYPLDLQEGQLLLALAVGMTLTLSSRGSGQPTPPTP
ncbi:O-antigen ligase family protein [Patescibacteria group bacterium]|nr:O-antigen ligase family protein [Patescibacteria group bacterium]